MIQKDATENLLANLKHKGELSTTETALRKWILEMRQSSAERQQKMEILIQKCTEFNHSRRGNVPLAFQRGQRLTNALFYVGFPNNEFNENCKIILCYSCGDL